MATQTPGRASFGEIEAALQRNGADQQTAITLAAIAYAESSGYTAALNPNRYGTFRGLFQIGDFWGADQSRLMSDDVDYQAQQAMRVLQSQGLGAWETYTTGAYQKYLSQAQGATSSMPDSHYAGLMASGISTAARAGQPSLPAEAAPATVPTPLQQGTSIAAGPDDTSSTEPAALGPIHDGQAFEQQFLPA